MSPQAGIARRVFLLAWPLTITVATLDIPDHERKWIRSKILLISKIMGNGTLEIVANVSRS